MKVILSTIAVTGLLCMQSVAFSADDYGRPDNICGQIHASKTGDEKDAAIARCIQERYKENRATGSQEVEHAKRKQCDAGPESSDKEKRHYMADCDKVTDKPKARSSNKSDQGREIKKLGKGGLDTSGGTHSGSSNKPASSTNSSGGVNTGNSESPQKDSK